MEEVSKTTFLSDSLGAIANQLARERNAPEYSDFVVIVDGIEYKCHKLILGATSKFFHKLFHSGMKEALEGKVTLQGISKQVFEHILDWIYIGQFLFTEENIIDAVSAADLLEIESIFGQCQSLITQILSHKNCLYFYRLSQTYQWMTLLKENAWKKVEETFELISPDEFQCLSAEEMKTLVSSSNLKTSSEDFVIETILMWVKEDNMNREQISRADSTATTCEDGKDESKNWSIKRFDQSQLLSLQLTASKSIGEEESSVILKRGGQSDNFSEVSREGSSRQDNQTSKLCHLVDLLKSARYLLISNECLSYTLHADTHVQKDEKCKAVIQEIIRYKLQVHPHQSSCILPALHRETDPLIDIVLTCYDYELMYITLEGSTFDWEVINLSANGYMIWPRDILFYGGILYLFIETHKNQSESLNEYDLPFIAIDAANKSLGQCDTFSFVNEIPGQLCPCRVIDTYTSQDNIVVGDRLITLRPTNNDKYDIYSMTITLSEKNVQRKVGTLLMEARTLLCITNIGVKLIIFWKVPADNHISVECYDLNKKKSVILKTMLNTKNVVSFKHGEETYVLQEDGMLWKCCDLPQTLLVSLDYVTQLWSGLFEMYGAIIMGKELLIFSKKADSNSHLEPKCLDNVFQKLSVCPGPGYFGSKKYIHAVVRRNALKKE